MDAKEVGVRIAVRRKEKKLTQQQLADKLNVTNKAISKWETGDGLPDITILPALADVLGTSTDHLLGKEEAGPREVARERLLVAIYAAAAIVFLLLAYHDGFGSLLDGASLVFLWVFAPAVALLFQYAANKKGFLWNLLRFGLPLSGTAVAVWGIAWAAMRGDFTLYSHMVFLPLLYAALCGLAIAAVYYGHKKHRAVRRAA